MAVSMMYPASIVAVLSSLWLLGAQGSNSTSSGVPCYLQPAGSSCHYKVKPGSDVCTTPAERRWVKQRILLVNRTLVSLEQQLIRLGIIPPDNTCSRLPPVSNGGVIYSNLNLAPGESGRYICNAGYALHSFQDRYEFVCTEDGVWDGNVTEAPIECLLSTGRCNQPDDVENGTISYTNGDPANVFIGDVITYSCEEGSELVGPMQRYCLRNGNWSGSDPQCSIVEAVEIVQVPSSTTPTTSHETFSKLKVIGFSAGSAATSALAVILVVILIVISHKCKTHIKNKQDRGRNALEIRDESDSSTPYMVYHDSTPAPAKKRKGKVSSESLIPSTETSLL